MQVCSHDLRSTGERVRWLPSAPPGPPDLDGRRTQHKLAALGHWSDEVDGHLFSFVDLKVTSRGEQVIATSMDTLGSWVHVGSITDISVSAQPGRFDDALMPRRFMAAYSFS